MLNELSKGERTRNEIIIAAYRLFLDQGYHGTSMRQISEQANIALGGIYNHFSGKEDIFEVVLKEFHPYHQIIPALQSAEGDTISGLVRDAAQILLHELGDRRDFFNLIFIEIVEFECAHLPSIFDQSFPHIFEFTERVSHAEGNLRPIPIAVMIRAFIGLFYSYILTEYMMDPSAPIEDREHAIDRFVDIYLYGILSNQPETLD
jgi:AcrR family transcriptional regulator